MSYLNDLTIDKSLHMKTEKREVPYKTFHHDNTAVPKITLYTHKANVGCFTKIIKVYFLPFLMLIVFWEAVHGPHFNTSITKSKYNNVQYQ